MHLYGYLGDIKSPNTGNRTQQSFLRVISNSLCQREEAVEMVGPSTCLRAPKKGNTAVAVSIPA